MHLNKHLKNGANRVGTQAVGMRRMYMVLKLRAISTGEAVPFMKQTDGTAECLIMLIYKQARIRSCSASPDSTPSAPFKQPVGPSYIFL